MGTRSATQDHNTSKPYLRMLCSLMSVLDKIIRLHIEYLKKRYASADSSPPYQPSLTTLLPLHPCPPCTSVSPHPREPVSVTHPTLGPSLPGSSHHHHHHPIVITCCVSGKSSIKAQHGFGTAESCSSSSPTTSTKRQLSPTPREPMSWNTAGQENKTKHDEWEENSDTYTNDPLCLRSKMLRCVGPVRPHP